MTSHDDLTRWDAAAAAYTQQVTGTSDSFYRRLAPFLWDRFGEVRDLDVLDLGCGHGWLADLLRQAGARVTGIDGSAALLAEAAARYPGITFTRHDLATGLPRPRARWPERSLVLPPALPPVLPPAQYDRIVSHMVLMDIPDLDTLMADIASSLRPGGVMVFSILHPAFFSRAIVDEGPGKERYRKVTGYLEPETRWIESFGGHQHYHRPLSWYVDLVCRNGLVVTGLHEPPTLPSTDIPVYQWSDYQRWFSTIPTMLAVSCRKSGM